MFQAADLLFQKRHGCAGDAIAASRKTTQEKVFNHVALFISEQELIHALDPEGVETITLTKLLESGQNVQVMRIQNLSFNNKNKAIKKALRQLGKPYDHLFNGTTQAFYCSSLIQHVFPQYFELQSMTFKDKHSGQFHPYWLEHFKKLGLDIPEGEQGTHPMGLMQSPYLSLIKV